MKVMRTFAAVCAACAAAFLLSSCGAPQKPEEADVRKIVTEEVLPQILAKALKDNDSEEYVTSDGKAVLFNAGDPQAEDEKEDPDPDKPVDYLRFSRECELTILMHTVESVNIGEVKQDKNKKWVCPVTVKIQRKRVDTTAPARVILLEKGFPLAWSHLPDTDQESFRSVSDFHDAKFDLCFLYEQLRNGAEYTGKTQNEKVELIFDPAEKKWKLSEKDAGKTARNMTPLDSVLAQYSPGKLEEFYSRNGWVLRSERDPESGFERKVFCDKLAAEFHDRMENQGQIYDKAAGKWMDLEEKNQSEELQTAFARYKQNNNTLDALLHVLGKSPKATMRNEVIARLKADIRSAQELFRIPTEKNKQALEALLQKINTLPDFQEEAVQVGETIAAIDKALSLYRKQENDINQLLGRMTQDFSGFLAVLQRAEEKGTTISELEKKKRNLFQPLRKIDKDHVDKILAYLGPINYRKPLPSLDSMAQEFFSKNKIVYRPFNDEVYKELVKKYIDEEMAKAFPVSEDDELAALKKRIEADKSLCAPKIGDVITVSCKTGPYAGRDITGKFFGANHTGINVAHVQIHWNDLTDGRDRFDSKYDARRKDRAFQQAGMAIRQKRSAFRTEMEKSPKLPELRKAWAWKAGWLVNGKSYISIKELFAGWYGLTKQQNSLFNEQISFLQSARQDRERFREIRNGTDPCEKYVFAFICLKKLAAIGDEEIIADAHSSLQEAAGKNIILAQTFLGRLYLGGLGGLEKSPKQAFFWLKKAADQGDPEAIKLVARLFQSGTGTNADQAAAQKYGLAVRSEDGNVPVTKNDDEDEDDEDEDDKDGGGTSGGSLQELRQRAESGDPDAQCKLGDRYYEGNGVQQDYREAVKWFRKAAQQGNAEAQAGLGLCYLTGEGVPEDAREAVKWLRKSAEQGNASGQILLGLCYEDGIGVPKDMREAVKWYRKAAEQGNAEAQNKLGLCYYESNGVQQDYREAVKWFRKAAEQGNADAQTNLGACYILGRGVPKDPREAAKWFRKAAEQGYAKAQGYLGLCYENGKGVPEDKREAAKWYRKAAEQGDKQAQEWLRENGY